MAADAGVDRAYMSLIEREQGNATIDILDRMAAVLGVEIAEFFRMPEAGEERPKPLPGGRKPAS